ncbi:DUF3239 domain-containing protein [Prauserella muralis]|uniref:DUF3239 domain-containing protein n=1 Tax=Prauserella muralis TaxID=588067 RepID=A0A2V4AYQ2_9PSEU|nr:DUF3239 domain-containing protein [Prauserella muralis]PXY27100.1 hypothetical protein BAY60_11505 [Prauserella muralis]
MSDDGWPSGDPRRFFDAPIDPAHLRASSPNVYRRAVWIALGLGVGGGLIGLGAWAIVDGRWWSVLLGALALVVGLGLLVRGLLAGNASKPYRGGPLVPGLVVEQADATVQLLVLGDTSRDPAAPPAFAYRLVTFEAREGTRFVPGQWVPCVMHGFVAPPWSRQWWNFEASPVVWATADPDVLDRASNVIPQAEWEQLRAGTARVAGIRRSWSRLSRIPYEELHESLRRPPTRLGVPVEWQADGRARFVGSVSGTAGV